MSVNSCSSPNSTYYTYMFYFCLFLFNLAQNSPITLMKELLCIYIENRLSQNKTAHTHIHIHRTVLQGIKKDKKYYKKWGFFSILRCIIIHIYIITVQKNGWWWFSWFLIHSPSLGPHGYFVGLYVICTKSVHCIWMFYYVATVVIGKLPIYFWGSRCWDFSINFIYCSLNQLCIFSHLTFEKNNYSIKIKTTFGSLFGLNYKFGIIRCGKIDFNMTLLGFRVG